jgi:hypothetical protein
MGCFLRFVHEGVRDTCFLLLRKELDHPAILVDGSQETAKNLTLYFSRALQRDLEGSGEVVSPFGSGKWRLRAQFSIRVSLAKVVPHANL